MNTLIRAFIDMETELKQTCKKKSLIMTALKMNAPVYIINKIILHYIECLKHVHRNHKRRF